MNNQAELERLFREVKDGCKRISTLTELSVSRPMFFAMDCRGRARELRALADELERIAEEKVT